MFEATKLVEGAQLSDPIEPQVEEAAAPDRRFERRIRATGR